MSQVNCAKDNKVLFEVDERNVAIVTLNQPDIHNAFDDELIRHLTEIFNQINQNNGIRAMVLKALGKSFSAGADINWMKRMATYSYEQNLADANALANMLFTLNTLNKPTIARVQGAAYGGAIGLIACCDMAVGSKLSKFCLSEVKLGLIPATISPYVIDAIGPRIARRYFTTAEVFSARRARRIGLLSEAVVEEELDSTVDGLISHILKNSPAAVDAAKKLIFDVQDSPISDELLSSTSEKIAEVRMSAQGQEGLNAFLQKRKASWVKE